MELNKVQRVVILLSMLICLSPDSITKADAPPPAMIKMPHGTPPAVSGEEYTGEFMICVLKPGVVSNFNLEGEGWTILFLEDLVNDKDSNNRFGRSYGAADSGFGDRVGAV